MSLKIQNILVLREFFPGKHLFLGISSFPKIKLIFQQINRTFFSQNSSTDNSMNIGSDHSQLWRQCVNWFVRSGVIQPDHRLASPTSTANDFAIALRDGVLLCILLNRLRPNTIDLGREVNLRPQNSQFLCLSNLLIFKQYCQGIFNMMNRDIFDVYKLYQLEDFGEVRAFDDKFKFSFDFLLIVIFRYCWHFQNFPTLKQRCNDWDLDFQTRSRHLMILMAFTMILLWKLHRKHTGSWNYQGRMNAQNKLCPDIEELQPSSGNIHFALIGCFIFKNSLVPFSIHHLLMLGARKMWKKIFISCNLHFYKNLEKPCLNFCLKVKNCS